MELPTLAQPEKRRFFQVNTAGCVDNGKSTLIGRFLFDCGGFPLDVIQKISERSAKATSQGLNLALFTDGLRAEEEQGITIDVARHYISRNGIDLIIADTPGHQEFTRNMVTGTSGSKVTFILVDATKGIVEQNRRHAYIAAMLGVEHITVLINKMDLVNYSKDRFDVLSREFDELITRVKGTRPRYIPISALHGDNVVQRSTRMLWYDGHSVLEHLEHMPEDDRSSMARLRYLVQWIEKPTKQRADQVEFAGTIVSGTLTTNDLVSVVPRAETAVAKNIRGMAGPLTSASFPLNARVTLDKNIPVQRGDILTHPESSPVTTNSVTAQLCWMMDTPLTLGANYLLKVGARSVPAAVSKIYHTVDIGSFEPRQEAGPLRLNEIAEVEIQTSERIAWDLFSQNRATGRFILIDLPTRTTAAAGIVQSLI